MAIEFLKNGCSVACLDDDYDNNSASNYTNEGLNPYTRKILSDDAIEEIVPREDHELAKNNDKQSLFRYKCDSNDRNDILKAAQDIRREIGSVDVLVTCSKNSSTNILDSVSKNLINHYWVRFHFFFKNSSNTELLSICLSLFFRCFFFKTMLAFVPSITRSKNGNVVTVIPNSSKEDSYIGTKAAIAGL